MTAVLGPGRPFTGTERELLESTLELHRGELVAAVQGLSDAQSRQQLVPSLTTPISLIKHCAAAERIWFQRTLAAMAAEDCDGHSTGGDSSFHVTADETLADTAEHRLVGTVNLRFIYLCMIGDIARHAGQADILVEQIRASHHKVWLSSTRPIVPASGSVPGHGSLTGAPILQRMDLMCSSRVRKIVSGPLSHAGFGSGCPGAG